MPDREGSVDKRVCSCAAYLRSPSRAQNSRRVVSSVCVGSSGLCSYGSTGAARASLMP